jgi:hypothetical protein
MLCYNGKHWGLTNCEECLQEISGKNSIISFTEAAVLGASRIKRKKKHKKCERQKTGHSISSREQEKLRDKGYYYYYYYYYHHYYYYYYYHHYYYYYYYHYHYYYY